MSFWVGEEESPTDPEFDAWVSQFCLKSDFITSNEGYHIDLFVRNQQLSPILTHSLCQKFVCFCLCVFFLKNTNTKKIKKNKK